MRHNTRRTQLMHGVAADVLVKVPESHISRCATPACLTAYIYTYIKAYKVTCIDSQNMLPCQKPLNLCGLQTSQIDINHL